MKDKYAKTARQILLKCSVHTDDTNIQGLEVLKLEFILRLIIMCNDWLLVRK